MFLLLLIIIITIIWKPYIFCLQIDDFWLLLCWSEGYLIWREYRNVRQLKLHAEEVYTLLWRHVSHQGAPWPAASVDQHFDSQQLWCFAACLCIRPLTLSCNRRKVVTVLSMLQLSKVLCIMWHNWKKIYLNESHFPNSCFGATGLKMSLNSISMFYISITTLYLHHAIVCILTLFGWSVWIYFAYISTSLLHAVCF